jgi:hypothetical protein
MGGENLWSSCYPCRFVSISVLCYYPFVSVVVLGLIRNPNRSIWSLVSVFGLVLALVLILSCLGRGLGVLVLVCILSCHVLSCLVMSWHGMTCLVLSCLVFFVLSCLVSHIIPMLYRKNEFSNHVFPSSILLMLLTQSTPPPPLSPHFLVGQSWRVVCPSSPCGTTNGDMRRQATLQW